MEIIDKILKENPEAMLSGSHALKLMGLPIRREPKDIDIYIPYKTEFKPIEGMKMSVADGDNDKYDPEGWHRITWEFNKTMIDVFTPDSDLTQEFDDIEIVAGYSCVNRLDILKMKLSHAFGDHYTRFKHRDDVIHLLINGVT